MKGYIHHVEGKNFTFDPVHQAKLREREYLLADFRNSGLVLGETTNFMAVLKAAPSSHKDFMVIYTGTNNQATNLSHLSQSEVGELFDLLQVIYDKTSVESNEELVMGLHTSIEPQPGALNSVSRPHFHVMVFPRQEGIINHVRTEVHKLSSSVDNHADRDIFGVTPFGIHTGLGMYLDFLRNPRVKLGGKEVDIQAKYNEKNGTVDFTLDHTENPYTKSNKEIQLQIYEKCLRFLRSLEGTVKGYDTSKFGFAFSTLKEEGKSIIRVGFFEKGGLGGADSTFYHKVRKTRLDNPEMPLMHDFQYSTGRILLTSGAILP